MVLFTDATILTETPPLRACWSLVGQQAEVSVTGDRDRTVVLFSDATILTETPPLRTC